MGVPSARHPGRLALIVGVLGMFVGLRGIDTGDDSEDRKPDVDAPADQTYAPAADDTAVRYGPVDSRALGPIVHVQGVEGAVGGLATDTVLRIQVEDFSSHAVARAMQCAGGSCGNVIPVQFGEDGTASFLYLVTDDFVPAAADGRCRLDGTACSLVIEATDGDDRASVVTLFSDELPAPGRVRLDPSNDLKPRQQIGVAFEGFVAGSTIELVVCASPATSGSSRCSVERSSTAVDSDGAGRASFRIPSTVGSDGVACVESKCTVGVRSSTAFVRADPVRLHLASPPPVDYDRGRLLAGSVVAGVLLALAAFFVRRTDWSPVGEEAAPEIDDAEYADLDALVAAMPPEVGLDEMVESRR